MANINEKLARFEEVKGKVEQLQASGIDLRSKEAVPLGLEFIHALDDLAQEFGYKILQPIEKHKNDFIRPDPTTQR